MRYNGIYDTMTFPVYQFQEFPKWIKLKDGSDVIVNSQGDELKAIASDKTEKPVTFQEAAEAALEAKDEEILVLRRQLEALAVKKPEVKVVPQAQPKPLGSTLSNN